MRIYGKYYLIPFLYGIIFSWYGTFHVEGVRTLQELVLDMGCYVGDINSASVGAMIEKNLPYILYVILFST